MNAASANPVGRPRSFDESEVLRAAMDVFWRKGYEGTSLSDLMKATGLHKGSLYQAFGDKQALFISALREFLNSLGQEMNVLLGEARSGVEGMRKALYYHIDMGLNADGSCNGCLALNTLVESAATIPAVRKVLDKAFSMRDQLITAAVQRAQAEGDMRSDIPADRIASMMATFEAGLMASLKGPLKGKDAKAQVDDFLASFAPA